jgi:hypothetical protein
MSIGTHNFVLGVVAPVVEQPVIRVVRGRENVIRLEALLIAFSERCGQTGAMQDLAYFLSKPGAMARVPYLVLALRSGDSASGEPRLDDLLGVLLIFEYQPFGIATGAFATNDRSGRSTVIALPGHRATVVALTTRALLKRGAQLILISYRNEGTSEALSLVEAEGKRVGRWAQRERTIPGYLPLAATYDATLAKIGQRTRSNLRYYRRRAETRLGCVFLPAIDVSRDEVLAFNLVCMYPVQPQVAGWRYESLKDMSEPILMGIQDGEGRWLSMLGGRRYGDRSEILWQLNREGYAVDSLSTVMRSYFIEHEINRGSRRLYIEGGTPHPIRFSFVPEILIDLAITRHSSVARLMEKVARRYISPDNELSYMLGPGDLEWLAC